MMPYSASHHFKSDIQGLRAFAVLLVILSHANIAFFEGGYIGVDIFFVISGYLISSNIEKDLARGQFSFLEFYAKRAKRIFPALFLTLALSTLAAWGLMLNQDIASFGESVTYASLFASNFYFAQDVDYFTPSSSIYPLLHTWSLAVEEQFYIVFPLFLFFSARFFTKARHRIALGLCIASFAICLIGSKNFPTPNFYSPITRTWEFLAGYCLIAFGEPLKNKLGTPWIYRHAANLGLLLMTAGLFFLKNETPYPSVWTLLPVLGAMLVIISSEDQRKNPCLSHPVMVFIGGISYSLYLVHFPVFSFSKIYQASSGITIAIELQILLVFALAYASYRLVEEPSRVSHASNKRVLILSVIAIATFALIGSSLAALTQRWKPLSENQLHVLAKFDQAHDKNDWDICTQSPPCLGGNTSATDTIVLWGDSHAYSFYKALSAHLEPLNIKLVVYTNGLCPPIFDASIAGGANECMANNLRIFNQLQQDPTIKAIVLVARWAWYIETQPFNNGVGGVGDKKSTFLEREYSNADRKVFIRHGIENSLDQIASLGRPVLLVDTVPEPGWNVLKKSLYLNASIDALEATMTYPEKNFEARNEVINGLFTQVTQKYGDSVWRIQPKDILCQSNGQAQCVSWAAGMPLYSDDNHLSRYGAEMLSNFIFENTRMGPIVNAK